MQIHDLFPPKFLRGQDLHAPALIRITGLKREKVFLGPGKPPQMKWILNFEAVSPKKLPPQHPPEGYGLPLRPSLAKQIFDATHTQNTDDWVGAEIVVYPETVTTGDGEKLTVYARARRNDKPQQTEQPAAESAGDTAADATTSASSE
jgi:hypothetical protein